MFIYMIGILFYMLLCIGVDYIVEKYGVEGRYYLLHTLTNFTVVYLTLDDLIFTYCNFADFINYPMNYTAMTLTFGLHLYHTIWYFKKLRFDDWLHHILTCGIALPLAAFSNAGSLLGHSLFYTTGLPGGIDYLMLFLNRNGFIEKITEKRVNNFLNLWLRCPGCISQAALTVVGFNMVGDKLSSYDRTTGLITAFIVFWNGIYFMNQVVVNYAIITNNKRK